MKSIIVGNAILCEFVAKGENNKHVLVNTFSGDIVVGELPAAISLGFYLEIIPSVDRDLDIMEIEVYVGKKKVASLNLEIRMVKKSVPALVVLPQFHISVESETEIRVVLKQDGYRSTTALAKKILLGSIGTQALAQ